MVLRTRQSRKMTKKQIDEKLKEILKTELVNFVKRELYICDECLTLQAILKKRNEKFVCPTKLDPTKLECVFHDVYQQKIETKIDELITVEVNQYMLRLVPVFKTLRKIITECQNSLLGGR